MCELDPIDTAPIRLGESFGPCLFFGRTVDEYGEERYAVGVWDGEDWIVAGVIFNPTHYQLLPPRPEKLPADDPLKAAVDDINKYAHIKLRDFYSRGGSPSGT